MLNYIWEAMLIIGFLSGAINGRMAKVTDAVFLGSKDALELSLGLLGIISLWSGIINIADKSSIINYIGKFLEPIINFLFPDIPKNHVAKKSIIMNLTANFLGLGNAATPLGIKAIKELQTLNNNKKECTKSMSMFLILNSVCLQLIPSTIISIRASMGAKNPSEIVYVIWIVSLINIALAIVITKIFEKLWR